MGMNGNVLAAIFSCTLLVLATILMFAAMVARYKHRELQHRERMAAIEKGGALPPLEELVPKPAPPASRTLLLRGLVWLFVGIAIVVSFAGIAGMGPRHSDDPGPAIGLIGLIPIGVGLAYLVTWRSERAKPSQPA